MSKLVVVREQQDHHSLQAHENEHLVGLQLTRVLLDVDGGSEELDVRLVGSYLRSNQERVEHLVAIRVNKIAGSLGVHSRKVREELRHSKLLKVSL